MKNKILKSHSEHYSCFKKVLSIKAIIFSVFFAFVLYHQPALAAGGKSKASALEYVLITEDCPFYTDFSFVPENSKLTLITRVVHEELTPLQKEAFDKIVVIDDFKDSSVLKAVKNNIIDCSKARLLVHDDTIFSLVANIRETLNIPGPNLHTIRPFCDKAESKRRLKNSKVQYPKFIEFDSASYQKKPAEYLDKIRQKLQFPLIVKPISLAGAFETQKLASFQELKEWCKKHTPAALESTYGRRIDFEIEEFVNTDNSELFHCDSIIKNGKVLFTQVFRYTWPCMEATQGKPIGSVITDSTNKKYYELNILPELVIRAFKKHAPIPDGVMHLEAFRDKDSGKVTFLETQLRPPGADIRSAYSVSLNFDFEEMHFKMQMGLPTPPLPTHTGLHSMWAYIPTKDGVVDSLVLPELKSKIHKMYFLIQEGQKTKFPSTLLMSKQTALKLVISNNNYAELLQDFEYIRTFQPFILAKVPHEKR